MKEKKDMIRIVRDEDGHLELDTTGRKNGRGAYICNTEECLKKAFATKGLERSFKMQIDEAVLNSLMEELRHSESR